MNRNLDAKLKMVNGTTMVNGGTGGDFTIGAAISDALIAMFQQEMPQPSSVEKDARFNLGMRATLGGVQEFTLEELGAIKKCSDLMYGTLIYGQISAWADDRGLDFPEVK